METPELNPSSTTAIFQRHLDQRRLLTDVSQQIASSAGLAEILPHILSGICEATKAAGARIILEDNGGLIAYAMGPQADQLAYADIGIHQFSQRQTLNGIIQLSDSPADLDLYSIRNIVQAIMIVPLFAQQTRQGTLWLGFYDHYQMPEDEEEFINLLTLQAAIAIANARAFEAARRGREQLAAILASALDAIIMVDKKRRIQVFNPAAESLFNIKVSEAMGQLFSNIITNETLVSLIEQTSGEHSLDKRTLEYIAPDGRTYAPHVSEVIAENGEERGYLLVLRDVSHFKRLVENMGEFLHTVSHDLRSPLTAAKGNLDMLQMVGTLNEKQSGMQEKILTSIADMTNLIEKVLDAGRLDPEMGTYQIRRDTCDPSSIVNKIVSTLNSVATQQEIALQASVAPNIPILNLDEMMLERALTNLAENAIKYSPEGTTVTIGAHVENDYLVLSVKDNGYGIPEEDQGSLFERGKRIRRREHRSVRGSGLGLFIVKNVAEQHGGKALLQSKVGEGSTFFITIPLVGPNLVGSTATS